MKKLIILWVLIFILSVVTLINTYQFLISPIWVVNAVASFGLILLRKNISNNISILLFSFSSIFLASLFSDFQQNLQEKITLCMISATQILIFIKIQLFLYFNKFNSDFKNILNLTIPTILSSFVGGFLFMILFNVGENYFEFIDYFLEQTATGLSVVFLLYGLKNYKKIHINDYLYVILFCIIQYYISVNKIFYGCLVFPIIMCYFSTKYHIKSFCFLVGFLSLISSLYITIPLAGKYWSQADIMMLSRSSIYRLSLSLYLITFLFICELYNINHRFFLALERITFNDELTGLKNRHAFKKTFLKKGNQYQGCILLLDIDDFKKINDQYGHAVGDLVLKHLSTILKSCCPKGSFISRWGGEEFLIVLPNHIGLEGKKLCSSILARCESSPYYFNEIKIEATVSIGITDFTKIEVESYSKLINHVDDCLYEAKSLGKKQFIFKKYDVKYHENT
ncbi:MAG: GGDEF domain-containing protein [Acinetobacter sp.]